MCNLLNAKEVKALKEQAEELAEIDYLYATLAAELQKLEIQLRKDARRP